MHDGCFHDTCSIFLYLETCSAAVVESVLVPALVSTSHSVNQ